MPPLTVRIQAVETPLAAGRAAELRCRVTGSRPAAQITWWTGDRQLPTDLHKVTTKTLRKPTQLNLTQPDWNLT